MIAFLRRYQVLLCAIIALFLSLYILTSAATGRLSGDPVSALVMEAMRPLQSGIQLLIATVKDAQTRYRALKTLSRENQELKDQIMGLEARVDGLLETAATNQRLEKLLELKVHVARTSVNALVIGNGGSTWFQSLTLNKGTKAQVRKGMAVITPMGIVGQVVSVSPRTAKVLLVTDHNSGVDVISQRSRTRGIVSGSLDNGPIMHYAKRNADIQAGDRLITSGLDGIFPKGVLVGTVDKVSKNGYGLFQDVKVSLAVDPSRVEEVLLASPEVVRWDD